MATAKQKITLNASRDIPFNKLMLSQANVRRIKNGQSIEDLASSIARRGLLQSLNVRPVLDGERNETGMFEVPAGGRRYRALELLIKQKRMARTETVPCVVSDANSVVPIEEDSLAENFQREDLHPLDMFRAFHTLHDQGATHEEIAARFFVSATFVQQRLRLAKVSPKLLDIYEQDGMRLDQLMAFTVTDDHARQEQVWETLQKSWSQEPHQIRRMLTETAIRASDRRALFVGVDAYVAAGGIVLRDLFEADNGGWLQDPALLDRLLGEKLRAHADEIAAEGWKWIVVDVDLPYGHEHGMRSLTGTFADLTDEEKASREALRNEYDQIEAQYGEADELPDEVDQRLGEIEQALERLENRPMIYEPAEIARAGAFVSIDRDGDLVVDRGYVRPEDEAPATVDGDADQPQDEPEGESADPAGRRTTITIGAQVSEPDDEDESDAIKPLPERLVIDLTAHRTLALRNAVAGNPHIAMTALLHRLVLDCFGHRSSTGCLEASVRHVYFTAQDADLKDSPAAKAVADRQEAWKTDIPTGDDEALWTWLDALDEASRLALLAHCVSFGINALYERINPYGAGVSQQGLEQRLREADRLARVTGLDMVDAGWRPTVANYLGRVTKSRILEAVREGAGERAAQLIDHLKKGEMAKEAERLLADSGWLPEPLRLINDEYGVVQPDEDDGDDAALPAFLAGEEDPVGADADEPVQPMAAE